MIDIRARTWTSEDSPPSYPAVSQDIPDILKNLKKDVIIEDAHGGIETKDITNLFNNNLYIFGFATLRGSRRIDSLTIVKTDKQSILMRANQGERIAEEGRMIGSGMKVIRDEKRQIIADVINNIILIHFDIFANSNEHIPLLDYIYRKSKPHLKFLTGRALKKYQANMLIKNLTDNFERQIKSDRNKINMNLDYHKNEIDRYTEQLAENIRKLKIEEVKHKAVTRYHKDISKKIKNELKCISRNKQIEGIASSEGNIYIKTKEVVIDGLSLGKYTIIIRGNIIDRIVSDKATNEFQHPHIKRDGKNVCWGNYQKIAELMANYELAVVVNLIIRFLSTWNPSDPYVKLDILVESWERKVYPDIIIDERRQQRIDAGEETDEEDGDLERLN